MADVKENGEKTSTSLTIEDIATFCKRKGFVYQNSEIYGGMTGFFDYGPLGCEMKNNLKQHWWRYHVHMRDDVVGIDGSIITHPTVWKASGHVANFEDIVIECGKCGNKLRADVFIEEKLSMAVDGLKSDDLNTLIKQHKLVCPKCRGMFKEATDFNLMFKTTVGPTQDPNAIAYLRPETAQVIFADFKLVMENARMKLPFGIAQIGKAFRNEISPRNFLFRCREFEQMEIEYFIHPDKINECPYIDEFMDHEVLVYSAYMQSNSRNEKKMTIKEAIEKKIIKTTWHAYWLANEHNWFISLGANPDSFRIRQHLDTEKSHYALDTWDLEYKFPFGWKELQGMANRTDFDLKQHIEHSKTDLSCYDEESKKKVIPYVVAEPSQGVDRAFLVFMFNAYSDDKVRGNIVLKLSPLLAPIKVAVFPLVNKEGLPEIATSIYKNLRKEFNCNYDKSGSVGRRYARNDEIGTPFCVTVDFDSKTNNNVTIRDRDSTEQVRVKIDVLKDTLVKLVRGDIKFSELKK